MKKCSKCNEWKDNEEFSKKISRKDGLRSECKKYEATYRAANKEKIAARMVAYRTVNREKIAAYNAENRDTRVALNYLYRLGKSQGIKLSCHDVGDGTFAALVIIKSLERVKRQIHKAKKEA